MKRLFLLLSLALFLQPALAQEQAFSVELVREFTMPRDQIFDNAALWLAESTKSSKAVIELKDKDIGTIIGNAAIDLKLGWGTTMPMVFKLRIDVKENRYRMTFSQVNIQTNFGPKPIEMANRESLEPKARDHFEQLAASFHAYLASAAKEKAW